MPEGKVYVTTWKRTETGYRVWVKRNSKLAAEGATFEEADQRLWEVIGLATGDGENMHEYVPAPPNVPSAGSMERKHVWELGIQSGADMIEPTGLFQGGLCSSCLMPRGPRTDEPLIVDRIESRVHAATATLPKTSPGTGPSLSVFSEDFLALLTPNERSAFVWRQIQAGKKDTRVFFELVPPTAPVPYVGVKGYETYYAVCETCGWKWIVPDYVKGRPSSYVADSSVPDPIPSLTLVGDIAGMALAASEARWQELVGQPSLKGIKGSVTAIIADEAVERDPEFKPRAPEKRAATAPPSWFER